MERLFILYGEQNAGKTSTLRKVFELLTGYTMQKSHPPKGDFRVIFKVGDKTVFMATYGDTTNVVARNFGFFNKTININMAYEFIDGKLQRMNNSRYHEFTPDICISACRIYKNGTANTVFNEANKQIMNCMPVSGGIQWIAKSRSTEKPHKRKNVNTDLETALQIVSEIIKESIL